MVSIRKCFEGAGVDDSFVIHQLVPLLLWKGEQFIGIRIPDDLVRVDYLEFSWLEEGVLDFVEDILSHDGGFYRETKGSRGRVGANEKEVP